MSIYLDNCCGCDPGPGCKRIAVQGVIEWHGAPRFSPWLHGTWSYADGDADTTGRDRIAHFLTDWSVVDAGYGGLTNAAPGSIYDHQRYLRQEWFASGVLTVSNDGVVSTVPASVRQVVVQDPHVDHVLEVHKYWGFDGATSEYHYSWDPETGVETETGTNEEPYGWGISIPAPDTGYGVTLNATVSGAFAEILQTGTVDYGNGQVIELSLTRRYSLAEGYSLEEAMEEALAFLTVVPSVRGHGYTDFYGVSREISWAGGGVKKEWVLDGGRKVLSLTQHVGTNVELGGTWLRATAQKVTFEGCGDGFFGYPYVLMVVTDEETGAGTDSYLDLGSYQCTGGAWTGGGEFTVWPADMPVVYGSFELTDSGGCP
jgi:hypothetical protein